MYLYRSAFALAMLSGHLAVDVSPAADKVADPYVGYYEGTYTPAEGKGKQAIGTIRTSLLVHGQQEDILILDVNLQEPTPPLQGQTHRANLQRTGVHYTKRITRTPSIKWKFPTDGPIAGSPLCYRDVVYVAGGDSYFFAINAETGKELWKFKLAGLQQLGKFTYPTAPTIKNDIIYTAGGGYIYALDIRTGRPKWKTTFRGLKAVRGSPLPVYGAIFAITGGYGDVSGLLAMHGETGQLLTIYRNKGWGGWNTMAFGEGMMFYTSNAGIGAIDMRSGSRKSNMGVNTFPDYCTPIVYDGKIYAVATKVTCSDYRSGIRRFPDVHIAGKDASREEQRAAACSGASSLWNDRIFFVTKPGSVFCHDALTGGKIWQTKLSSRVKCSVSVSTELNSEDAIVYTGSEDGMLWALDAVSGNVIWKKKIGGLLIGDVWVNDGVAYVASEDGHLYCLEAE